MKRVCCSMIFWISRSITISISIGRSIFLPWSKGSCWRRCVSTAISRWRILRISSLITRRNRRPCRNSSTMRVRSDGWKTRRIFRWHRSRYSRANTSSSTMSRVMCSRWIHLESCSSSITTIKSVVRTRWKRESQRFSNRSTWRNSRILSHRFHICFISANLLASTLKRRSSRMLRRLPMTRFSFVQKVIIELFHWIICSKVADLIELLCLFVNEWMDDRNWRGNRDSSWLPIGLCDDGVN